MTANPACHTKTKPSETQIQRSDGLFAVLMTGRNTRHTDSAHQTKPNEKPQTDFRRPLSAHYQPIARALPRLRRSFRRPFNRISNLTADPKQPALSVSSHFYSRFENCIPYQPSLSKPQTSPQTAKPRIRNTANPCPPCLLISDAQYAPPPPAHNTARTAP